MTTESAAKTIREAAAGYAQEFDFNAWGDEAPTFAEVYGFVDFWVSEDMGFAKMMVLDDEYESIIFESAKAAYSANVLY